MLPMINVNPQNNDGDIKKQLSSLRTQMATLRDAIEADLSNIRYDNLSPDLQKRIDEIDKTATSSSETISMVAQSLAVNYATIKELSAATARIGTIEANYITSSEVYTNFLETKDLSAEVATLGYATVGQLNAVDAKITNLDVQGRINVSTLMANTSTSNWANINVAKINYIIDSAGNGGSNTFWHQINGVWCLCCVSIDDVD